MNLPLKLKILEKFKSQADFAQVIDVDESVVSRIIQGRRQLNHEKRALWAKALKCKPKDIFADEG